MSKLRQLFVPMAFAWLFVHVSVMTGTAVLLLTSGASERELVCRCGHGADHGSCPMHGKPADAARCHLQGAQEDFGLGLIPVLGPLTLPVLPAAVVADTSSSRAIGYEPRLPSDPAIPPDLPPPRA